MQILFGIPDETHRELANLEINGIKALNPDCHTIHYGPVQSKRGFINKIIFTLKNAFLIKRALKERQYDVLFLNTTFDFNAVIRDSITFYIIRPKHVKVFLKFHGLDPALVTSHKLYKTKLADWLLNHAHGLGVLSSEEKGLFFERGLSEDKIFIIKIPIDPSLYIKDVDFKKKNTLSEETFVFIFCARFLTFKGLMDVLKALSIIIKKHKSVHLFCIGDGPEMNSAQIFADQNKLNSYITFTGFIPEIETRYYYSNADALVFPSSHEGFPMAVFQSMAAGVPIITSQITAAADYLKEPDNVLWVKPHEPDQLADAMMRLLTDKSLVDNMRNNNAKGAFQFTTDKNALEYLRIFEMLTKKKLDTLN